MFAFMKYRSRKKLVTVSRAEAIRNYTSKKVKTFVFGIDRLPYTITQFQILTNPSHQRIHWN